MTTPSQQHLTDDQFAACLAGESPTADVRAHLAACDLCREEASLFFSSVESLDKTTLAWSKDQPSVSPRAHVFQPARSFLAPSVRWVAVAALALVSVAVLLQRDYRDYRSYRTTPDAAVATASAPSDSAAQIAQDNKLLASVNMALAGTEPSPFSEYGLETGGSADGHEKTSKSRRESRIQ
jgi:hypothetical protein